MGRFDALVGPSMGILCVEMMDEEGHGIDPSPLLIVTLCVPTPTYIFRQFGLLSVILYLVCADLPYSISLTLSSHLCSAVFLLITCVRVFAVYFYRVGPVCMLSMIRSLHDS